MRIKNPDWMLLPATLPMECPYCDNPDIYILVRGWALYKDGSFSAFDPMGRPPTARRGDVCYCGKCGGGTFSVAAARDAARRPRPVAGEVENG